MLDQQAVRDVHCVSGGGTVADDREDKRMFPPQVGCFCELLGVSVWLGITQAEELLLAGGCFKWTFDEEGRKRVLYHMAALKDSMKKECIDSLCG